MWWWKSKDEKRVIVPQIEIVPFDLNQWIALEGSMRVATITRTPLETLFKVDVCSMVRYVATLAEARRIIREMRRRYWTEGY